MDTPLPHVFEVGMQEETFDLTQVVADPSKPLEIEIGCGNGRFLAANALKRPDVSFIGVERMMERVRRVSKKAEKGELANLTVLRVEAGRLVDELLPAESVDAFYLFFPDPWPKRRHHKNRFFQRERCDSIFRTLKSDGLMHISTDHKEYFDEMYLYLREDARFVEVEPLVRGEDEQTDFERLFLSKSQPIYSCGFKKVAQ